jgi:hypothetical protein
VDGVDNKRSRKASPSLFQSGRRGKAFSLLDLAALAAAQVVKNA